MTLCITLEEDEFDARFPLVPNHLNPNASWAFDDGPGHLFETYGEEFAFVSKQDPLTVWTFVDGDDGSQWLLSGLHRVNRIGYLISHEPIRAGESFEVQLEATTDVEP